MTVDEVEACQQAIELCIAQMADFAAWVDNQIPMPRVADVTIDEQLGP